MAATGHVITSVASGNNERQIQIMNGVTQSAAATSDVTQIVGDNVVPLEDDTAKQVPTQTPAEVTWTNPVTPARLKWCGCLASSPCSHFANYHQNYQSSSYHSWNIPYGSFTFPHGLPQTGVRFNPIQYYGSQPDLRQLAKLKAQIVAHPMYDQLLAAHVACLRIATPVDHLQSIDAQLSSNVHLVAARYSSDQHGLQSTAEDNEELDRFMANYIVLLQSFKEQLHEHVRVQAMDAVVSCWEIEKAFVSLTGISPGEGSGATMSDDEEDVRMSSVINNNSSSIDFLESIDNLGLGPLLPTESERSLMERVRLELKSELKQGYKNRIADVREEILRKRRAGKLPTETTAILKKWWNAHAKWPYPTEDEKARLVQETGLELKQINNWFINQRKRNWHSHASASTSASLPKNDATIITTGGQTSTVSLSLNNTIDKATTYAQDNAQHVMTSFAESP